MKYLPKQLWKEEFNYYSDKSVLELKADIQQLFNKSKWWDFSVNLTGEFTSDFEFKMTPKWQFAVIKSFEREVSFLNGRLYADESNRTLVTFTVRPNSVFLIFFFLFPIIGIVTMATEAAKNGIGKSIVIVIITTLVIPIIMTALGHFFKQEIKNSFIQAFDLKPYMQ